MFISRKKNNRIFTFLRIFFFSLSPKLNHSKPPKLTDKGIWQVCVTRPGIAASQCVGQRFILSLNLNLWEDLSRVSTPHFSDEYCFHFCLSGLTVEERFLHGCWGLLEKLSVARAFPSALTSPSSTHLISKVTANSTENTCLWWEEIEFSYTTSPKLYIVSKAIINLDCKTSQYLMFICVKTTIAKQQVYLISLEGKRLLMKRNIQ